MTSMLSKFTNIGGLTGGSSAQNTARAPPRRGGSPARAPATRNAPARRQHRGPGPRELGVDAPGVRQIEADHVGVAHREREARAGGAAAASVLRGARPGGP